METLRREDGAVRQFVLSHTHVQTPPLVREVRLHLGTEVMPLWETLTQQFGASFPPPLWAYAWAGGQALARYLLDHQGQVRGKAVLDFASGSGLCAIAAAQSGATSVLAADIDPFCGEVIPVNAAANGVEIAVTDRDLLERDPPDVDLILAGDICYEEPTAGRVLSWLRRAHAGGVQVLIGDPGRAYCPVRELVCLAQYTVPTPRDLEGVEVKRAGVYTFGPNPAGMARYRM
jgi:predicted nicotinamide N-methyase